MLILSKLITIIIVLTIAFTTILQPQAKNSKQSLCLLFAGAKKPRQHAIHDTRAPQMAGIQSHACFCPRTRRPLTGAGTRDTWQPGSTCCTSLQLERATRFPGSRVTLAILSLKLTAPNMSGKNRLKQSDTGSKRVQMNET